MIKVLVVDDSALMRKMLGRILRQDGGMEVAFARDGVDAIAQLHAFQPDVVTLDINMPRMDGLACLNRIMVERPTRVVMVSSETIAGADVTLEAMALGAVDFIHKPDGPITLALERFGPAVAGIVRAAAGTRLRQSARLTERVRLRTQSAAPKRPPLPSLPARILRPRLRADSVVLVGTSTGGPLALDALLSPLPSDFPWPILVAQHMPASFTASLARRLNRLCALDVAEVSSPTPIAPGRVYIARGDADMIVSARPDGLVAMAAPSDPAYRWHPSVDRLVTSAMQHAEPACLIGVLMTGMGNDGASAMARLRQAGGRTIAEAEETAVVWGMPGELVRAGGADMVAPLEDLAGHLMEWAA